MRNYELNFCITYPGAAVVALPLMRRLVTSLTKCLGIDLRLPCQWLVFNLLRSNVLVAYKARILSKTFWTILTSFMYTIP
jgi:hypothetical protein